MRLKEKKDRLEKLRQKMISEIHWGLKVFESNDPNCIWKPIGDDGTYYYTINYIINCGIENQNKSLKGFISVLH